MNYNHVLAGTDTYGLLNPRSDMYSYPAFQFLLDLELRRFRQHKSAFSLLLLSLPQSEAGLRYRELIKLAKDLATMLRPSDLACHYKNYALVFILPETSQANGQMFVDQFKNRIGQLNENSAVRSLDVAVVLVALPDDLREITVEQLLTEISIEP